MCNYKLFSYYYTGSCYRTPCRTAAMVSYGQEHNFVKCQSDERQYKGPLTSVSALEDSIIKMLVI